jgi:hypothetical protein
VWVSVPGHFLPDAAYAIPTLSRELERVHQTTQEGRLRAARGGRAVHAPIHPIGLDQQPTVALQPREAASIGFAEVVGGLRVERR